MVDQIAETLQLGKITKYYKIEEIRSSKEINMALYVRKTEGKHIIPIPYVQVEQNILKKIIMKGKKIFLPKKKRLVKQRLSDHGFIKEPSTFLNTF